MDELAHTNASVCRYTKRYQDIEELLNAGIDVYTTVNVQHIESLNDTVVSITDIMVHECIPDSVFDNASQVELIDIVPQELIERLQAGKVYNPTQAERATAIIIPMSIFLYAFRRHLQIRKFIRTAARMANAFKVAFTALFVETGD